MFYKVPVTVRAATGVQSNSTREKKMTAPQPYSVIEEKDRREDVVLEEKQPESLHEQIDAAVLELHILSGSLGTVGELMLNADREIHSVGYQFKPGQKFGF